MPGAPRAGSLVGMSTPISDPNVFDPFATPPAGGRPPTGGPSAGPHHGGPPAGGPPPAPPEPRVPWWQRDGVVSRLLVGTGVAVTLVGVVLLLVIAAQNGLLGPQVRVAGGALLSAALVAAGVRVMDRPGGRLGGTALMGTGAAGLYLVILAMTTFYDWLPTVAGLALALGVVVGGAAAAMHWRVQMLAVVVNLGCAMLAPALTGGANATLVAFLVVFALVGAVPELRHQWSWLAPVRTVPAVFAAMAAIPSGRLAAAELVASSVILLVGLGTGLVAARTRPHDVLALGTMAIAYVPALLTGARLDLPLAAVWCVAISVGSVAAGVLARPLARPAQSTLLGLAALSLLEATSLLTIELDSALPVLLLAIVLLAADLTRPDLVAQVGGQTVLLVGVLLLGVTAPVDVLALESRAVSDLGAAVVLSGLVALVAAVLGGLSAWRSRELAELRGTIVGFDVVAGLYAASAAFIALGLQILPGTDGFALGHFLATAAWTATGFGALQVGLHRPAYARVALTAGLALVAAALSKLFLFDLAALSGLARAGAFLVVGVALLVAGTRYARSFADRDQSHEGSPGTA